MSIGDKLLKSAAGAGGLTPSENFKVVTYTGNGGTQAITGVGFKPDVVWAKKRSGSDDNVWFDTTRGVQKELISNSNAAEATKTAAISSFDSDGFTTGNNGALNSNGDTYVAWCWKANGGTTSSNTDGSQTTTVQANTAAGVSIITGTMGSSGSSTFGHGLGVAPKMIIHKDSANANAWMVYHESMGAGKEIRLNETNAATSSTTPWGNTAPTTTVYTGGNGYIANAGANFVAYCFAEVDAYSKFGSYTGNASTNIIETGFEVGWLMIKRTDSSGYNWVILDNKRSVTNPRNDYLNPNTSDAETTNDNSVAVNFLSNGFEIPSTSSWNGINASGGTYIYMAFATDPDTEAPELASSFNIQTYGGDGSTSHYINGLGFKPNLVWGKALSSDNHRLSDSVIDGAFIYPNLNNASDAGPYVDFNDDGFTMLSTNNNTGGTNYVAWTWKANDDEPTAYGGPATAIYKMEDNVNDVNGNFNASATSITYSSGKFNKAATFTGGNSQGGSQISVSNDVLGESNSIFSISLWVKCDNSAGEVPLFGNGGTVGGTSGVALYLLNGSLSLTFRTNPDQEFYESIISLNDDNWHHVVMTYGNGPFKLYVDNVLVKSGHSSYYLNNTTPSYDLFFGNRWNRNDNNAVLNGQLDQIRIYDGVINAADVDALYNETASDNDDIFLGGPPEIIVSVNANAGFSIAETTFSGEGTIPHGLSQAPNMVILKGVDAAEDWNIYHSGVGTGKYLSFSRNSGTDAVTTRADSFSSVTATSVTNSWTSANVKWIMYSFHDVAGYSKFGTYTGDGGDGTGPTVTTGFKPDFVMVKRSSGTGNWQIYDSRRHGKLLFPNDSAAEQNLVYIDFLSTGFKPIAPSSATGDTNINLNGSTYIYAAFKKNVASNTTLANSFKAVTYSGNGSTQSITGTGFKPDLVWIKQRSGTQVPIWYDSVRGTGNYIYSSGSDAEGYSSSTLTSFDSDGFSVGSSNSENQSSNTFVAWCWKAGNTWQSNIDGTIPSIVNVNTANGFSIVKYTGNATSGATVGHGLSAAPDMVIAKGLSGSSSSWWVQHSSLAANEVLELNSTNAKATYSSVFNNTAATSTVVTLGNGDTNRSGETQILYCFHDVAGYSKFGSYTGGGSTNPTINLGFEPDFLMVKKADGTVTGSSGWTIVDSARHPGTPSYENGNVLYGNATLAEQDDDNQRGFIITSTGFTPNGNYAPTNNSGDTYIYMAFKMN